MKQSIGLIRALVVVSAVFFVGCSKETPPTASATPTHSPSPVTELSPDVASVIPYPLPADDEILTAPPSRSDVPTETRREPILRASAMQLVKYEITGTGSSSGESMLIGVENTSGSPIEIFIAPGTVMLPNGDAQRMLAWGIVAVIVDEVSPPQRVTSLYLPDATPRLAVVEAYCLDFELPNPERTDAFTVAAQPQIAAASVVYAAKKENLSSVSTQIAVWKNQDEHITQTQIEHKFEASQEEFDKAFELVKRVRQTRKNRSGLTASLWQPNPVEIA